MQLYQQPQMTQATYMQPQYLAQTQNNQLDLDALRGRSSHGTMGAVQGAVGGKNINKFKGQIKNVRQTLKDGKAAFDKTYKAAKSGNYAEAMKDARSGYKTL